jgi:hypothetical protein
MNLPEDHSLVVELCIQCSEFKRVSSDNESVWSLRVSLIDCSCFLADSEEGCIGGVVRQIVVSAWLGPWPEITLFDNEALNGEQAQQRINITPAIDGSYDPNLEDYFTHNKDTSGIFQVHLMTTKTSRLVKVAWDAEIYVRYSAVQYYLHVIKHINFELHTSQV